MMGERCEALCDAQLTYEARVCIDPRCTGISSEEVYLAGRKRRVCWLHGTAFLNVHRSLPVRFFDKAMQGARPIVGGRYRLAYAPSYMVCVEGRREYTGQYYNAVFFAPDELQGQSAVLHSTWFAPGYYELDEAALG